jgi:hypothetical protein
VQSFLNASSALLLLGTLMKVIRVNLDVCYFLFNSSLPS